MLKILNFIFLTHSMNLVYAQSMLIEKTSINAVRKYGGTFMQSQWKLHDGDYSGKTCEIKLIGDKVQMICDGNWVASDKMESFVAGHKLVKEKEVPKSEYTLNIEESGDFNLMNKIGEKLVTRTNVQSADILEDKTIAIVSKTNQIEILKIDSQAKLETLSNNKLKDVDCSTKLKLGVNIVVSYCKTSEKLTIYQRQKPMEPLLI